MLGQPLAQSGSFSETLTYLDGQLTRNYQWRYTPPGMQTIRTKVGITRQLEAARAAAIERLRDAIRRAKESESEEERGYRSFE